MTGVQTCALPICFPVTILEQVTVSFGGFGGGGGGSVIGGGVSRHTKPTFQFLIVLET